MFELCRISSWTIYWMGERKESLGKFELLLLYLIRVVIVRVIRSFLRSIISMIIWPFEFFVWEDVKYKVWNAFHSPSVAICFLLMIGQIRLKPLSLNAWRRALEDLFFSANIFQNCLELQIVLKSAFTSSPESPPFTPGDEFNSVWQLP